ncbi:hypothetical protein [Neorhodopirellula lusitana]|uniref:hypothetical protein n=1 Tax=Neorhodopirellula lusitana TaxID=445327 RepID=UPI00384B3996
MKYRHLYRSSVLLILATAAISVLGLRGVISHSHGVTTHNHSDGDEKYIHGRGEASSISSLHHHEHFHHHEHAHQHPHQHTHDHVHPHPPSGPSIQDSSHDPLTQSVSPNTATEIASTRPHSHYVFFGFEFVVFESGNRGVISNEGANAFDLRSWLVRVFHVRSPLPPENLAFESTPVSILCIRTLGINGGRVSDPPSTPPPEFAAV